MKPKCLIIGGGKGDEVPGDAYDYIFLDINPDRKPDIVADACKIPLEDKSVDAIYASHVLEHINPRRNGNIIEAWYRLIKPGGEMLLKVPNLTIVAEQILEGKVEHTIYLSPAGPITPLDMLVGLDGPSIGIGMVHRWGFTRDTLAARAQRVKWKTGLVWEHREASPYDRCELRLYGRKIGKGKSLGWNLDQSLDNSGDPYAIHLGG